MSEDSSETTDGPAVEKILRIPVTLEIVLGSARMAVADLMKLGRGAIIPLDRKIGDPVDIVVNGRVVARGEVVVLENEPERLGITFTEVFGGPPLPPRQQQE